MIVEVALHRAMCCADEAHGIAYLILADA